MDANVFDMDQEEDMSTRAARKEDAEELARLNEHDRRKRRRRMMMMTLESMAAEKRRKKGVPVYCGVRSCVNTTETLAQKG